MQERNGFGKKFDPNSNMEDKKILIETESDLDRLPMSVILNTKLYNFKGKYFEEEIFQLALKAEEDENVLKELGINSKRKGSVKKNRNRKISPKKPEPKTLKKNLSRTPKKDKPENKKQEPNVNILAKSFEFNNLHCVKMFKIDKIQFQMRYSTQMGEDLAVLGSIFELGNWEQWRAFKLSWTDGHIWKGVINFNSNYLEYFEYKFIFWKDGHVKQWEDGNNRIFSLAKITQMFEPRLGSSMGNINISNNFEKLVYDPSNTTLTIICEWNKKN